MKIASALLAKKIKEVKGIIPSKTTLEALYSILVKNGYLIASNTDMTVMVKLEGIEDTSETFLLPPKAYNFLLNMTGDVEIVAGENNSLKISNSRSNSLFASVDPGIYSFDIDMQDSGEHEAVIDAEILKTAISKVLFAVDEAASTKVTALGNIYLEASGEKLNVCGMCTAMMAWNQAEYSGTLKLLLPISAAKKLMTLDLHGEVKICDNGKIVKFSTDDCIFQARISEGDYVDYTQFFNELSEMVSVDRQEMIQVIGRVNTLAQNENSPVRLEFFKDECKVRYDSAMAKYEETLILTTKFCAPAPVEIGFNAKFLLELLKAYPGDEIDLNLQSASMPMLVGADDCMLRSMILPVRIATGA